LFQQIAVEKDQPVERLPLRRRRQDTFVLALE